MGITLQLELIDDKYFATVRKHISNNVLKLEYLREIIDGKGFTYLEEDLINVVLITKQNDATHYYKMFSNYIVPKRKIMIGIDANIKMTGDGMNEAEVLKKHHVFNTLKELESYQFILMHTPYSAEKEIKKNRIISKVNPIDIFTIEPPYSKETFLLNENNINNREKFLNKYRGNMLPANIDPDLKHVFESIQYHAEFFLTRDQNLLKRNITEIKVITPEDFLLLVREDI